MATARISEIVASASTIEGAVDEGLRRAHKKLRGIASVEITRIQARVEKKKVKEYRVHMNLTFVLE